MFEGDTEQKADTVSKNRMKTSIPRGTTYSVHQGKVPNDEKTIEENNIGAEATIEMSLRLFGEMEENEMMESLESEERGRRKGNRKANRRDQATTRCSYEEKQSTQSQDRTKRLKPTRRKQTERWTHFLQTVSDGSQFQGMNTTIVKMKEGGDDRYKQINERIANMEKKISDIDEKCENINDELNRSHDDQNQCKAVVTGFHSEHLNLEVEQLLKVTTIEKGMSIENARIECFVRPITHAFIYCKRDDERNKYVRSANMLRKELRGRKI